MTEFPDVYQSKASPEWATVCPDRSPEFKAHSKKGLAHSAIAYHKPHTEIALYRLEVVPDIYTAYTGYTTITGQSTVYTSSTSGNPRFKTQWKKVWEYTYPENCDFCENPIRKRPYGGTPELYLPYHWKGRVIDAPVVCGACYHAGRTEAVSEQKRREDIERLKVLRELYPDI